MKRFFSFVFYSTLFFSPSLYSQNWRIINTIIKPFTFFTTDKLGSLYLVGNDGLFAFNDSAEIISGFHDKSFGTISYVDATDPLKILVYNYDFKKVFILDNKLSLQVSFSLYDLGIVQPELVCTSLNNGYWVYDGQQKRVLKFNSDLQKEFEGEQLSNYAEQLNPTYIVESSQWIFLNNASSGIIVLDRYGTYYKTLRPETNSPIQVYNNRLYYLTEGKLHSIDVKSNEEAELNIPPVKDAFQARIENKRIFIAGKDSVSIYEF